ncbi:CBS domain-containing protein [Alloiococcus otitis]|uniref:CBS domain-containing protein n=1 Tax=Alloiococcus otitis TaxID=1652 RepID=UPI0023526E91|nr:CBS domain-containing protein [Alloiococcus otitis]
MKLSDRQKKIINLVKEHEPITGDQISDKLGLSKPTIRPDLSLLSSAEILIAKPKVGYLYNQHYVTPFIISDMAQRPVEEVMKVPIIVAKETPIIEAINLVFLEDAGSLYVTDNSQLVGIVSRKDLLKAALMGSDVQQLTVSFVMSRAPNLVTVNHTDSLAVACKKLVLHKVNSLPVLEYDQETGQEKIVGKLSKTVITNVFYSILEGEQ